MTDELFDRDDGSWDTPEERADYTASVISAPYSLEPDVQAILDKLLERRDKEIESKITLAKSIGMDGDELLIYACDQWRKAGVPVVKALYDSKHDIIIELALPAGVG